MKSRLLGLLSATSPGETWERDPWRGKAVLYALSFLGTAISLAAVAWSSGGDPLFIALIAAAGLGHVTSGIPGKRRLRLGLIIYPAALAVMWTMRIDLLTVFIGGSLFPLAKILAVIQAMVSFNLRSMRSLYDSLLLSLAVILLVSEGALSMQFSVFLLAFGLVGLAFLAAAYPVSESQNMRVIRSSKVVGLAVPVLGAVLLTMGAAVAVFLTIPQPHRVRVASPLPSRLDLTIGRPVTPADLGIGDIAPTSGFLPTREEGGTPAEPTSGPGPTTDSGEIGTDRDGVDGAVGDIDSLMAPMGYVELGYVGEQDKDVVMYVRSPLASFWRGQVLDQYDGRGWLPSEGSDEIRLDNLGRLHFKDAVDPRKGRGRYVQSFFPQVAQPYAAFTGYSPGYIALQDPAVEGSLWTRGQENIRRLYQGSSYRVVSAIPALTPDMLIEASVDVSYLSEVRAPIVPARVRELALAIVDGSESDFEKAARLERFLLDNYEYDLRVSPLSRSGDVVEGFLFERRSGYCAQFATAMAVMARAVGLPARVAIGYVPGQYNSLTGAHTVRLQDSHAWVEIKFRRYGWVAFDPTPRPDSPWALDRGYYMATRSFQQLLRDQLKDVALEFPTSAAGSVAALFAGLGPVAAFGATIVGVGALVVMLLIALSRRRRVARRVGPEGYTLLPGDDRERVRVLYLKALRLLGKKGYPQRQPYQSPEEFVAMLRADGQPVPEAFQKISRQASYALYNPSPLEHDAIQRGAGYVEGLREAPQLT